MELGLVYQKMFEAVKAGGVEAVLSAAYEDIYQLPVCFADASFRLLVPNHPPVLQGDDIWDRTLQQMKVPLDVVQIFQTSDAIRRVRADPRQAVYLDWGVFAEKPRISTVIEVDNIVEGYIAVLVPREKYAPWQLDALVIVADALAIALKNEKLLSRNPDALMQTFARDLIQGTIEKPEDLQKYIQTTGIPIRGDFGLVVVKSRDKKQVLLHPYMKYHFQSKALPILLYAAEDLLFILVYNQGREMPESSVMREIFAICAGLQAMCGVSRPFSDLIKIRLYSEQAVAALETGYRMHPEKVVYHYDDYHLPNLLLHMQEHMSAENCIHPALHLLAEHDRENRSEYLKTLKTSLYHMYDSNAACAELHIHRNTHLYRMNRIKELTGLDYTNPVTNTELLISFAMMDLP